MGHWRSWLARFHGMEEVKGSNPLCSTNLLRYLGFYFFIDTIRRMAKRASKNRIVLPVVVTAFVILAMSGWLWWHQVYMNSTNVFWGMMSNNLATASITKHTQQETQGQSVDQYVQIQFGPQKAAHGTVTFEQNGSKVKSETIGTPKVDYNRYISINTNQKTASGKPIDTSSVLGVWSKSDSSNDSSLSNSQFFRQSILGIVPFANLNASARSKLISLMKSKNVYDISSGSIKSATENGRSVYVYDVSITPSAYVEAISQLAKELGLGDIGLDPSQYQGAPAFKTQFTVDKKSRELIKISYLNSGQTETFSSYGLEQPITEPKNAIPLTSLQERLQKILK